MWGRMTKEKWIALLAIGAILMILAVPLPGGEKTGGKADESGQRVSAVFTRAREAIMTREAGDRGRSRKRSAGRSRSGDHSVREFLRSGPLKSELKGFFSPWTVLNGGCDGSSQILRREGSAGGSDQLLRHYKGDGFCRGDTGSVCQPVEENTVLTGQGTGSGHPPSWTSELSPEISGIILVPREGGALRSVRNF